MLQCCFILQRETTLSSSRLAAIHRRVKHATIALGGMAKIALHDVRLRLHLSILFICRGYIP